MIMQYLLRTSFITIFKNYFKDLKNMMYLLH